MKKLNSILWISLFMAALSCSDDAQQELPLGDYQKGYFITNEGPFQNGSGTISFVGEDGADSQRIYSRVNGEDLGNIVNAMTLADDKAYIVVNNSNKLVVANRYTMEKLAVVEGDGVLSPRHFAVKGQTGYLSNWGDPFDAEDDFISVIDLATNQVIEKISVGEGPERMLIEGQQLYVCLQGGYGHNNQVVVIDTELNAIETIVQVGEAPNSIVSDGNGSLWILCGGVPAWTGSETNGSLVELRRSDGQLNSIDFEQGQHPSLLNFEGGNLYYYLNGKVYRHAIYGSITQAAPLEGIEGNFYSISVKGSTLYATDPLDYASEGQLRVYDLSGGALLGTISTGIVPGGVVFN